MSVALITSATRAPSRIAMLEYWYFEPGTNCSGVRTACSTNSESVACLLRNSLFSGNWSGKPETCVSRCCIVTSSRCSPTNCGMNFLTSSFSLNSPRSNKVIRAVMLIGLEIEPRRNIASSLAFPKERVNEFSR